MKKEKTTRIDLRKGDGAMVIDSARNIELYIPTEDAGNPPVADLVALGAAAAGHALLKAGGFRPGEEDGDGPA